MNFSNPELLSLKKEALLNSNFKTPSTRFFNYYNSVVKVNSTAKFLELIESTLPKTFISNDVKEDLEINILPQTITSYDEFENESSPDCFVEKLGDELIVIQRDFAAKRNGNTHWVFINNEIEDGYFNALRWILPRYLLNKNSLILHSSCVVENDEAFLFLGHSGHGKTTISTLSQPRLVLGDDMNVLSLIDNKPYMQSGAIGGQIVHRKFDEKFPLRGIFWLIKGDEHSLSKLAASEGLVKLSASAANLFWGNPEIELANRLTDIVMNVFESTPIYELTFQKDDGFWEIINCELS